MEPEGTPASAAPSRPSEGATIGEGASLEGQRVLAGVMSGLFGGEPEAVRLGRFVLLRRLGSGGMGEVFACYDATLDRKVAIKVLHRAPQAQRDGVAERLRAEAKAIAKLAHPNVVPVFEVGEDGGDLYLVMELVDGVTLRAWLAEAPRTVAEILDAFAQVARGLIAAHAAGVVHRDLKPDNVLVGHDGRVRLVDFGLARSEVPAAPGSATTDTARSSFAGTPRYMAPEQFAGGTVDARADQFAFCVSLFEALYGAPPFGGRTITEIAAKVISGEIDAPPDPHRVPVAIGRVVRRGLLPEADRRFATMADLLDAVAYARKAPTRRRLAVAGVVLAAVAVGVVAVGAHRPRVCADQAGVAASRWEAGRATVRAGLEATGVPWVGTAITRVEQGIAEWTHHWAQARATVCATTDAVPDDAERTRACLDDGLAQLDAVVEVLGAADGQVAASAADLVASLPEPGDCADPIWLASAPTLPPAEQRGRIAAVVPRLARIRAENTAGHYATAREQARALLPEVAAIGHAPTHAELLLRLGKLDDQMGDLVASERSLEQAYFLAGRHGLSRTAALSAISLTVTVGIHGLRTAAGQAWMQHAEMMAARVDEPEVQITLHHAMGGLLVTRGEVAQGVEELRRALALAIEHDGESHPSVVAELIGVASAESAAGDSEAAAQASERARGLILDGFGDGHPLLALLLHNAANDALRRGDNPGALALHREALAIRERAFGPDNLEVALSHAGIGTVLGTQGDAAGALPYFERAMALTESILGPDHPRLANDLGNAGLVHLMLGHFAEAQGMFERACALLEQGPAAEGQAHAVCLENLADALTEQGQHAESIAAYERALSIRARTVGPGHTAHALTVANLAIVLSKVGRHAEAIASFERALPILEGSQGRAHPAAAEIRGSFERAQQRAREAAQSRSPG